MNEEQMMGNAQYIMDYLITRGWTKNAIAGMLGNMQSESSMNPGIWEGLNEGNMSGGFGLVQWTPASKFTNWADGNGYAWTDMNGQLERILWEAQNGEQWISTAAHPISFYEFTKSTASAYDLAMAFIANYERPLEPYQPYRGTQAEHWFSVLEDHSGVSLINWIPR